MAKAKLTHEAKINELIAQMTVAEKIGQMTQVERKSIQKGDITKYFIGSILNGGGGYPTPNEPEVWYDMVHDFKEEALQTRLAIPLIYGTDAVHGHNNLVGATIFPHNIGLGATREADLVRRIGRATAVEVAATNIKWNFAPAVSIPYDIRWGRSYEGYSQNSELVTELGVAYLEGSQTDDLTNETAVLASVKHYIADGGTTFGTSTRLEMFGKHATSEDQTLAATKQLDSMRELIEMGVWKIDQGVSEIDEEMLRSVHLSPYIAAIEAGALNIMVSYSSWGGLRMHAQKYLLTDVLKGELGFDGFLVSDWEAIDQISDDFYQCVVQSINAGLDMIMVPFHYVRFITTLTQAVANGDVPESRLDDAVRRILRAKFALNLWERPSTTYTPHMIGCAEHRAIAREAVQKSAVLLKNDDVLPLPKALPRLFIAGQAANDVGYQCGGWSVEWMGKPGAITPGTTILQGIREIIGYDCEIVYKKDGNFDGLSAEYGLVVIAEEPYAEGMGDRYDLHLTDEQITLIENGRKACKKLAVILLSGRPLIITDHIQNWDAFVAGWLPGSEGNGISDLLFGDVPFTGKLSFTWPRSMSQIPLDTNEENPLFPFGFGLSTS